ncbi:uncharacterized protein B0H18DRAFT_1104650 [Fomitopsis serialis]|uniref:uncharacterized protein n=1 Tax=Fomitopsis serialis TaxID=139415 RepID=UPI002007647C|nr:uncharacterized protein B0H18DRAFT_1104650 [Neoantrodia serialis]KAH9925838.1 hypothetical protein B0H18DRAFT_1104650 [Neoantrodia serialis]
MCICTGGTLTSGLSESRRVTSPDRPLPVRPPAGGSIHHSQTIRECRPASASSTQPAARSVVASSSTASTPFCQVSRRIPEKTGGLRVAAWEARPAAIAVTEPGLSARREVTALLSQGWHTGWPSSSARGITVYVTAIAKYAQNSQCGWFIISLLVCRNLLDGTSPPFEKALGSPVGEHKCIVEHTQYIWCCARASDRALHLHVGLLRGSPSEFSPDVTAREMISDNWTSGVCGRIGLSVRGSDGSYSYAASHPIESVYGRGTQMFYGSLQLLAVEGSQLSVESFEHVGQVSSPRQLGWQRWLSRFEWWIQGHGVRIPSACLRSCHVQTFWDASCSPARSVAWKFSHWFTAKATDAALRLKTRATNHSAAIQRGAAGGEEELVDEEFTPTVGTGTEFEELAAATTACWHQNGVVLNHESGEDRGKQASLQIISQSLFARARSAAHAVSASFNQASGASVGSRGFMNFSTDLPPHPFAHAGPDGTIQTTISSYLRERSMFVFTGGIDADLRGNGKALVVPPPLRLDDCHAYG